MAGPPPPTPAPESMPPSVGRASPTPPASRQPVWLLLGLAGAAIVLAPLCCCGGSLLLAPNVSGSGGPLIGRWRGSHAGFGDDWVTEIEFKPSGRFNMRWTGVNGADLGAAGTHDGRWNVRETEGKKQILEVFYDREPNRAVGWTIVVNRPDHIDLSLETTHTFNLQRQR